MKFKLSLYFILIAYFLGGASFSFGSDLIGTSALNYLELSKSVKAATMAYAMTAGSGIHSIDINPAGIAFCDGSELNINSTSYIENISFHNFMLVFPMHIGTMGLNLGHIDLGSQLETSYLDESGASGNYFSNSGYQMMVAYAQRLEPFAFGLSIQYLSQSLESFTGSAIGMDAGLTYTFNPEIQFGMAINNITIKKLKFISAEEKLAQTVRLGMMYQSALFEKPFSFSTDFIFPTDGSTYIGMGLEYQIVPILELRAGYYTNFENLTSLNSFWDDLKSFTNKSIGLGLLLNAVSLDFMYKPYENFGASYRFGVGVKL